MLCLKTILDKFNSGSQTHGKSLGNTYDYCESSTEFSYSIKRLKISPGFCQVIAKFYKCFTAVIKLEKTAIGKISDLISKANVFVLLFS